MKVDVLELSEWETPASKFEVAQKGDYRIGKHVFKPGWYVYHGMDGYALFVARKPLPSTTLLQRKPNRPSWREWMVDSPTDYRAMQKYAEKAYGNVLTTGLGLGLLTCELCKNDKVSSITVVEISPCVIDLISGYLPDDPRIHITCNDFWHFVEEDNDRWDTIIADIWVYWGIDEQVKKYKQEIVPANEKLRAKYPDAQIFFHGFAGMPTVEQVDAALENGGAIDVDSLIYGLGVA